MLFRILCRIIRWFKTKKYDRVSDKWIAEQKIGSHDDNPKAQARYVK